MQKDKMPNTGNYIIFESRGLHVGMVCSDGNFYTPGINPVVFSPNQVTGWIYAYDAIEAWKREQSRNKAVDAWMDRGELAVINVTDLIEKIRNGASESDVIAILQKPNNTGQ